MARRKAITKKTPRMAMHKAERGSPGSQRTHFDVEVPEEVLPPKSIDKLAYNEWDRACAGKLRYPSESAALATQAHYMKSARYAPYQCQFCETWHVGHRTNSTNGFKPTP
jgi:hypothetical protein